jgi:hypothetical protein
MCKESAIYIVSLLDVLDSDVRGMPLAQVLLLLLPRETLGADVTTCC